MTNPPQELSIAERRQGQKAAVLGSLFSQANNQILFGSIMVLFANDVLGFAPKRIAAMLSMLRLVLIARVFLLERIRRLGRIRTITVGELFRLATVGLLLILPARGMGFVVYMALLTAYFGALQLGRASVMHTLFLDITTVNDRGRFFSRLRLGVRLVYAMFLAAVTVLVGRNITEAQYKVLLMFAAAGILFELFWLRRIPELPDASLLADPGSERRGRGHLWRVVKSARVLRWPLLAQVLWHLTVTPVGVLYFKRMLHVPSNVIALQQLMAMLGSIVSFAVWGRIADALGFRPLIVGLLIMAILVAPVIMLAAPLPDPLPDLASLELSSVVTLSVVLLLGLINGALSGGIGLALTSIQHFFTRRKNALEEMNIYLICVHLATALSVLVTGWLLEEVAIPGGLRTFGNNVLHWDWFRAYLVIVKPLLYTGLIAIVLRLPNTKPFFGVWDFFSSLFDGPVRIMMAGRRVYDGAEEQRISLARLHARRINPLHIETLLELSEDPSYDVRVEAIRALGTTRSNLAGDRLLTMLNDVTEDQVADQVAWSLGELGYQPAFDALVARLDSGYPTRTRAMAARALGKLGDKRAVPFLVEQITREERSLHLIASCNKALLRLEDSTHANLVFESLERLTNRVERYEMMALICEWLGISSQWLVRSSSQESWRDALLAETASRSVCWKESHRGVISALERRDSSGMAEQVRARAGTLQGAAAEIVDALADALGDNLRWNSLSVLGAAWLMFDGE